MSHDQTEEMHGTPALLQIVSQQLGPAVRVTLSGELDLAGRPAVQEAVDAALQRDPHELVVDFSGLTFADSSGVHLARDAVRSAAARRVDLAFIPAPPSVQRIFTLAHRIDDRFVFPWVQTPG